MTSARARVKELDGRLHHRASASCAVTPPLNAAPVRRAFFTDYANEGAAYLRIDAEDPETLLGVSPARLGRRAAHLARRARDLLTGSRWRTAFVVCRGRAHRRVGEEGFSPIGARRRSPRLGRDPETVRVTGDGNAEALARAHRAGDRARESSTRCASRACTTPIPGTDSPSSCRTIILAAGNSETPAGVGFVANLPTEEIFHRAP